MRPTAYEIEHSRTNLAQEGKFIELKHTYNSLYPEIKDINSSKFWNNKLFTHKKLEEQDGMTRDRIKIIAKFLPSSVKRVLDVGVGHGWIEEMITKKSIDIYANDISDKAIQTIKQKFNGSFSVQSIYELNYKENFFDAVFLLEVLEHIPPSKTFKVLKNINKLIKPKGYFIVSVPTNEGLETMSDNPNGHVRMYTVPLISAELSLSGFKIIKLQTLYAFKKHYLLKKILAFILKKRWKPNNIILLAQKFN